MEREGKERGGKEREGKERKGKGRKGKESERIFLFYMCLCKFEVFVCIFKVEGWEVSGSYSGWLNLN